MANLVNAGFELPTSKKGITGETQAGPSQKQMDFWKQVARASAGNMVAQVTVVAEACQSLSSLEVQTEVVECGRMVLSPLSEGTGGSSSEAGRPSVEPREHQLAVWGWHLLTWQWVCDRRLCGAPTELPEDFWGWEAEDLENYECGCRSVACYRGQVVTEIQKQRGERVFSPMIFSHEPDA